MRQLYMGVFLYILLLIPPIRSFMESVMVLHMLIQLPMLIVVGYLLGDLLMRKVPHVFSKGNENGVPGIILIFSITMYWMLPRALDEALTFPIHEVFKFISLPLVGILLADSWRKIKPLGQAFIYFNYLSMFALMAWLYLDSPIQICNNYLVVQQKVLGWGFLLITAFMVLYMVQYVFTDHSEEI
jgi:hypothetical protein